VRLYWPPAGEFRRFLLNGGVLGHGGEFLTGACDPPWCW